MFSDLLVIKTRFNIKPQNCPSWASPAYCTDIFSQIPDAGEIEKGEDLNIAQNKLDNGYLALPLKEYIQRRSKSLQTLGSSLSVGDPDYTPVAFLERTFRLSAAVCRIMRSFSFKEFRSLIDKWSPKDTPEICKVLESFFKQPQGQKPLNWVEFWSRCSTFKVAFESQEIIDLLTEAKEEEALFAPYATGFLVGKNHLLTNYHVLNKEEDEADVDKFRVQFRYERNLNNRELRPIEYKLDPSLWVGSRDLDYTLIKLQESPEDTLLPAANTEDEKLIKLKLSFRKAGENFGWLRMKPKQFIVPDISAETIKDLEKEFGKLNSQEKEIFDACKMRGIQGEPIFIIQHPRGRAKEIVFFNSRIIELSDKFIQYTADTDFGSSGSAILNANLQLIGLHYGALIEYKQDRSIEVKANVGTKVNAIIEDLEKKLDSKNTDLNEKQRNELKQFIEEYVYHKRFSERRIFLLGGRERKIAGESAFIQEIVKALIETIIEEKKVGRYGDIRIIDVLQDITLASQELGRNQVKQAQEKKRANHQATLKFLTYCLKVYSLSEEQSELASLMLDLWFLSLIEHLSFDEVKVNAYATQPSIPPPVTVPIPIRQLGTSDGLLLLRLAITWINTVCDLGERRDGVKHNGLTYKPGDVAIELLTDAYSTPPKSDAPLATLDALSRGISAYYFSNSRERRTHAELLLDKLTEQIPELRTRGAISDSFASGGRLSFCRDLYMPSLVLYLGFLENSLDCEVLGMKDDGTFDREKINRLAKALLTALVEWSDALNPVSWSPD